MFAVPWRHRAIQEVLKNPFGDITDGVWDASFMFGYGIGKALEEPIGDLARMLTDGDGD